MEEKINIAELLKDCPQGMELYSPIFGNVYLDKIRPHLAIIVTTDKKQGDFKEEFLYDGRYGMNGECMLFPSKEQRDWSKFQKPFKDGDIISNILTNSICIFKGEGSLNGTVDFYCGICCNEFFIKDNIDPIKHFGYIKSYHLATEKVKQKFFDDIKSNGYKWNAETKTLEKLIEENKNSDETKLPSFELMFKMNDELEYKIPDGYEITEVSKGKVFIKPIKPKYPTTYEECWKVRFEVDGETTLEEFHNVSGYYSGPLCALQKLLCCRDAYWKIAGKEMGLDKPWKPENLSKHYNFTIETKENQIICNAIVTTYKNRILSFPTKEMRDVFYENFKNEIEQCKELL